MQNFCVSFCCADLSFNLQNEAAVSQWLIHAISGEGKTCEELSITFCSDEHLLKLNQSHLNHDTYTDIITFDYSNRESVSGELFISVERVKENAVEYQVDFIDELHRVLIHGVLHLCGYQDKKPEAKLQMTSKEDYYLNLRAFK